MIKSNIIPVNEKINYKPLVLGYTFFKIVKDKTDIKGYWIYKNKLYIDNIKAVNIGFLYKDYLNLLINHAFKSGEKAVLYKNPYNEAIILYKSGEKELLINQTHIIERSKPKNNYIKELLKNCQGLTVYKTHDNKFLIEIYK